MKKYFEGTGWYEPSFFRLHIDTKNHLDFSNFSKEDWGAFVHEYTHFIQDFATLYGLQNIFNTVNSFRDYCKTIRESDSICLPLELQTPELIANDIVNKINYGTDDDDIEGEITGLSSIHLEPVNFAEYGIEQFEASFKGMQILKAVASLDNGLTKEIEIGASSVFESMAYLAENLMGVFCVPSPNYPYNMAKFMADSVCPEVSSNEEILYALCDVALQCTTPGVALYQMMVDIHSGRLPIPNDGYEVYKSFPRSFDRWQDESPEGMIRLAKDGLLEIIQGAWSHTYVKWVENLFSYAIDKRRNEPWFLIDMIRKQDRYSELLNKVGSPIMFNDNEQYCKVPFPGNIAMTRGEFDIEYLMAWEYVMDMCRDEKRNCPLLYWCTQSGLHTDNKCVYNPPERSIAANYNNQFCIVGAFWYHKALGQYRFAEKQNKLEKVKEPNQG